MGDNNQESSQEVVGSAKPTGGSGQPLMAFGIVGVSDSIRERRDEIIDQVPESNDLDTAVKDDIRLFFLWGHAVIEDYSAHLLRVFVIDDGYEQKTWDYISGESRPAMSQSHREELLQQSGVFDGIEGKISNIRGVRNELAHNAHAPIRWDEDNIEAEMDNMVWVIDRMHEALTDDDVKEDIRIREGL